MKLLLILIALLLKNSLAFSQQQVAADTSRIIMLSDVVVSASIREINVSSGETRNNSWYTIAPGGGHAVKFFTPQAQYHSLRSVTLYLREPKRIKEGSIRLRIASSSADGSPANDNLLPDSIFITTSQLQSAKNFITFEWPSSVLLVPQKGFFIVVEGVGKFPDDYLSKVTIQGKRGTPGYEIQRRTQPGNKARVSSSSDFPNLKGMGTSNDKSESWYCDTVTQEWKRNQSGESVIHVQAVFK